LPCSVSITGSIRVTGSLAEGCWAEVIDTNATVIIRYVSRAAPAVMFERGFVAIRFTAGSAKVLPYLDRSQPK
jgi:hypothetical protein